MSCACLLAYGTKAYANLRVRYLSLAIVCVATGLGPADPEMWPDTNGQWADAYSVRRFWGYVISCHDAILIGPGPVAEREFKSTPPSLLADGHGTRMFGG